MDVNRTEASNEGPMEIDEINIPRSRFSLLNGSLHNDVGNSNDNLNFGEMAIAVGIVNRSSADERNGLPGSLEDSCETVIHQGSETQTFKLKSNTLNNNGIKSRSNYNIESAVTNRDTIATVTIGPAKSTNEVNGCDQRPAASCGPHVIIPEIPIIPNPPPRNFQIFVINFGGKTYTFEVEKSTTVAQLMDMIKETLGIPQEQQALTFAGKCLVRGHTLGYYEVERGSTIYLTGRLRGGGL